MSESVSFSRPHADVGTLRREFKGLRPAILFSEHLNTATCGLHPRHSGQGVIAHHSGFQASLNDC